MHKLFKFIKKEYFIPKKNIGIDRDSLDFLILMFMFEINF